MLRIFVGVDSNEQVAAAVCAHSLARRSLRPISVTGLFLHQLPLERKRDPKQSTDFAFSRFLVPWLCDYQGYAVFMDSDILCRTDITEIISGIDPADAVSVVQHDYTPKDDTKFLGHVQTAYQRKNWSSVMVFNNARCKVLTPEYVDTATGLSLHQFAWTDEIGELDPAWNHLVGEYKPNPAAKIAHFTLGTPCFAAYSNCEFSEEWHQERALLTSYNRRGEFAIKAAA